jgi:hypothetical protein
MEDARLIGQTAYIYEVGSGLVVDGEETFLTGEFHPGGGKNVHALIEESGAPALLLDAYAGRLEHHAPWHLDRQVSHLFRGLVDTAEANELLAREGHAAVRLVDNGAIPPRETSLELDGRPHAYHLVPAEASKAAAVARHMHARGYAREDCIAVGDSREDLDVAEVVGRFYVVANALEEDPVLGSAAAAHGNVEFTEAGHGDGFYEAVVGALMRS